MKRMQLVMVFMLLVVIVKSGSGGHILSKIDWNGKDPILQTNAYGRTIEIRVFVPTEMNRGYQITKEGSTFYFKTQSILKKAFEGEEQVTEYLTEEDLERIFKNK